VPDSPRGDLPPSTAFPTQTSAQAASTGHPEPQPEQWVGRRVGTYRISKLLGRGGMGAVYLANRDDDQFRKNVALKLLRFGTDEPGALARFRNERQILAALDHPHIAALYDGGTTDEGMPYIVMEYVDGQPLNEYCTSHQVSIQDKLVLFRSVCDAVQYAHQKLVVHRDLKPSNILVTRDGIPKLLDFGIAKLLLSPELLGDAAPKTQTGVLIMTPEYASPEQILGQPVSTATDVYSLGVVLYELLTGKHPRTLSRYDPVTLQKEICETEPKPPSTIGGAALRGDLDTIVLKAMHRDAARRYRSVEQFSEDILRYLENRPVTARPDTFVYRLSRFSARNRWGIGAAAAVVLSLAAGTVISLSEAHVAQERFQQVRKLAGRFIELHDDVARLPGSTRVREKLVATSLDYLDNLARSAGNDAELLHELANAYKKVSDAQGAPGQPNLGRVDDGLRNFQKAIEFERRASALNPAYTASLATMQSRLAYEEMLSGHLPQARENLEAAAALLNRLRAAKPEDPDLLALATSVAMSQGDLKEYEGHSRERLPFLQQAHQTAVECAQVRPSNDARRGLHLVSGLLATALADNERYDEALGVLREAEPIIDALLAEQPQNPTFLRQKMAAAGYESNIYDNETGKAIGKPVEAAAAGRRYLALAQKLSDADPDNASAHLSLAIACYKLSYPLGKIDRRESLQMAQRALAIFDDGLARSPNDHLLRSRRPRALRYVGYALQRNGRTAEARQAMAQALAIQRLLLAENPGDVSEREQVEFSEKALAALGGKE
jgi:serine/threonine protein kinase/tetratricopeptide (TPR) repeat protein